MSERKDNADTYMAAAVSGGKDSTAMLLLMLERDMPIDCVLYADTAMDFPEMQAHIAKLDDLLFHERGIHITTLRHPRGFEWLMFNEPKSKPSCLERRAKMGVPPYGNGWPGIKVRWCTGQLKTHLMDKEVNRLKKEKRAEVCIGIAADEAHRCKDDPHKCYPLVEWGITEAQALQICYDRGFDFGGLYEIYHRASCWCCPFQGTQELRNLRRHHPELWARLLDMDRRARAQFGNTPLGVFKKNWTVERLDERFAKEEELVFAGGSGKQNADAGDQRDKVHRAGAEKRHLQVSCPLQSGQESEAGQFGHSSRQADGEAACRTESGRVQH